MAEFNINYFCAITNIIYLLTFKKEYYEKNITYCYYNTANDFCS